MVMAFVVTYCGAGTHSSPGMVRATSSLVAPQRKPQGRTMRQYATAAMVAAAAKSAVRDRTLIIDRPASWSQRPVTRDGAFRPCIVGRSTGYASRRCLSLPGEGLLRDHIPIRRRSRAHTRDRRGGRPQVGDELIDVGAVPRARHQVERRRLVLAVEVP